MRYGILTFPSQPIALKSISELALPSAGAGRRECQLNQLKECCCCCFSCCCRCCRCSFDCRRQKPSTLVLGAERTQKAFTVLLFQVSIKSFCSDILQLAVYCLIFLLFPGPPKSLPEPSKNQEKTKKKEPSQDSRERAAGNGKHQLELHSPGRQDPAQHATTDL